MTDAKKELTREKYLMALGLFTLGRQAYAEGVRAEDAMVKLLCLQDRSDLGHIQDEIYSPDKGFDEAMKLSGFIWANIETAEEN